MHLAFEEGSGAEGFTGLYDAQIASRSPETIFAHPLLSEQFRQAFRPTVLSVHPYIRSRIVFQFQTQRLNGCNCVPENKQALISCIMPPNCIK